MKKMLATVKRILFVALSAMLIVSNIPAAAFAEEAEEQTATELVEAAELEQENLSQPQEEVQPDIWTLADYAVPQDYSLHTVVKREYLGRPLYISEVMSMLASELSEAIDIIKASSVDCEDVTVLYNKGYEDSYLRKEAEIAAVFCALENQTDPVAFASRQLTESQINLLHSIYWDMVEIAPIYRIDTVYIDNHDGLGAVANGTSYHMEINVSFSSAYDYLSEVKAEQLDVLNSLMSEPVFSELQSACRGAFSGIDYTANRVIEKLPDDLDDTRKNVVTAACSLVGKVPYFWGGKSDVLGWDDRWNVPKSITSGGTGQLGDVLPYGLDCAGLISWAFINGAENLDAIHSIGHGVESQLYSCTRIEMEDVQPGDLVFGYNDIGGYGHVGIVVGRDGSGEVLVCHCSGEGDAMVRIEPISSTCLVMAAVPEGFYNLY